MPDEHQLIELIRTRALTLGERLATQSDARSLPHSSPSEALAPWVKVYSPGSREALLRRLEWDDISPDAAARALGEPANGSLPLPDDRFEVDIIAFAAASRSGVRPPFDPDRIPFAPVWSPFLDLAMNRAEPSLRGSALFSDEAVEELVRHLATQLSWWGSPALLHRFDAARSAGAVTFEQFCARVRAHPLEFWADHAALLRRLLRLTDHWAASTCELASRLATDREAIRETMGLSFDRVEGIHAGLSDRHHSGRQVAILRLSNGARLVYKPRECRSLLRFNELLRWYERHGGDEAPRSIAVLDRESYGWVEFVGHDTLSSTHDVERYFRRAGSLLCLAWMLGGRDLHMDNIICSASGPVIVDTEAFVPPRWSEDPARHPGAMQLARSRVSTSVVGTSMLSFPQEDATGRVYDIGGLCGQGGYLSPSPARTWNKVNTDQMHVSEETRLVEPMQNVVRRNGRIERPEEWVDEIVAGFSAAFEILLARRDELVSTDSPFSRFRDASCRIIFRPSNQYATLLQTMTGPACSRSGLTVSLYVESLARVFSREEKMPELWPLVRDERESLENLDIPLFSVGCSSVVIESLRGERLEGLIARSGVDSLVERLRGLESEALADQTQLIRGSLLSSSGHSAQEDETEEPITGALPADARHFLDEARRIGDSVLGAAIRGEDGAVTWIAPEYLKITSIADLGATYYLYSGVTGPSIFLAALGRVTGDSRFSVVARGAWNTLERLVESGDATPVRNHLRLGICNGIGSIIYAAVVASDLLGDPSLLDVARGFAALIDEDRIDRETDFDIEGGIAGATLALVRLYEATSEREWLDLAGRLAQRLANLAQSDSSGAWWVSEEGSPALAGMAHGAAGAAVALFAFANTSGRSEFDALARDAFRWERTVFDPSLGNWPVRTNDGRKIDMIAWCHGAAGIGLTRIAAVERECGVDDDLARAVGAVLATGLHPVDHVCCGNAGRIDFLIEASLREARPDLLDEARRRSATMIERAMRRGAYTLTEQSSEKDLLRPGFFRGLSGIGYTLLRATDPTTLPCITRFENTRRSR